MWSQSTKLHRWTCARNLSTIWHACSSVNIFPPYIYRRWSGLTDAVTQQLILRGTWPWLRVSHWCREIRRWMYRSKEWLLSSSSIDTQHLLCAIATITFLLFHHFLVMYYTRVSIPMGQGGMCLQYLWSGDVHGNVPPPNILQVMSFRMSTRVSTRNYVQIPMESG